MCGPGSDDWPATVNTPIQWGFMLDTGKGGFAEVQFENGSTIRLGEMSRLVFTRLGFTHDGGQDNCVSLGSGYATWNITPDRHDEYMLSGGVPVWPRGKAEFRTDVSSGRVCLEVADGRVDTAAYFLQPYLCRWQIRSAA